MIQALLVVIVGAVQAGLAFLFQEKVKQKFTEETEKLKQDFAEKISVLQADLAKQNIAYQINQSEFVKFKFEKVNSLYKSIVDRHTRNHSFLSNKPIALSQAAFDTLQSDEEQIIQNIHQELNEASIYFDEELKNNISQYLQISSAYVYFNLKLHFIDLKIYHYSHQEANDEASTSEIEKLKTERQSIHPQYGEYNGKEGTCFESLVKAFKALLS